MGWLTAADVPGSGDVVVEARVGLLVSLLVGRPTARDRRHPRCFDAHDVAQLGDQLPFGPRSGGGHRHGPRMGQVVIVLVDPAFEALSNRARTDDHEVIVCRQAPSDEIDEAIQVFLAPRFAGVLG